MKTLFLPQEDEFILKLAQKYNNKWKNVYL